MLNELIAMERGLAAHGFASVPRHPDLNGFGGKGVLLIVRLSGGGDIEGLQLRHCGDQGEVWTLRKGKQNGFPGLKTKRGLLLLSEDALAAHDTRWRAAESPQAKRFEIERLLTEGPPDPSARAWPGYDDRIAERLRQLESLATDEAAASVPAAYARFLASQKLELPFLHRLLLRLIEEVRHGDSEWIGPARAALIGAVPLFIDVAAGPLSLDASDTRQLGPISRALGTRPEAELSRSSPGMRCAYTGARGALLDDNFPKAPRSEAYLFSRNREIEAFRRYGQIGRASLPVSADLVYRISGALAHITSNEREGVSWRLIPREAGGSMDLLIAFISSAGDAKVADSFAFDNDEDDPPPQALTRAFAERATTRLVAFWEGVASSAPPGEHARIVVLRSVDKGNAKALLSRSPSPRDLHQHALEWSVAMDAAPAWICYPLLRKKKVVEGRPRLQAPLSLISLSKRVYIRGGREPTAAPGVSGAEALALFLNEGDRPRRARRILKMLVERQSTLLVGLTQAKLRKTLKAFDPKGSARRDALRSISWMAALLTFSRETKEATYMDDAGFKLGQLLAAVDAVHIGYCAAVRGGQVPPTLVGNSVFASAGRDPKRALAVLQTRWKPYHAWANRQAQERAGGSADKDDARCWQIRRAISQFRLASRLSEMLGSALTARTEPIDDAFRAELLLGYVAGVRPEKISDTSKQEDKGSGA